MKKMAKGDAQWSTEKAVLGWTIDIDQQFLTLTSTHRDKLVGDLAAIPNQSTIVSKKNGTESSEFCAERSQK